MKIIKNILIILSLFIVVVITFGIIAVGKATYDAKPQINKIDKQIQKVQKNIDKNLEKIENQKN